MNRQQYHTLHDSLEYLCNDLIDIHRQLRFFYYIQPACRTLLARKPYLNHLTRSCANRYSAYALEKDSARCGSLNPIGGQPPSVRYFFVHMSQLMGGTCGASSDAPVPIGRSANLQVLAHPFGRG